jgi:copper chaperone CopZ
MECPDCANRVRNALVAHPGVLEAETDFGAALARVWYDAARVSVREIVGVIAVIGEGTQHRFLAVVVDHAGRR